MQHNVRIRVLSGIIIVMSCVLASASSRLQCISVKKRDLQSVSFDDTGCLGIYDKSKYAKLDIICDDCYNLIREPPLHQLCRKDCFTSDEFKGCIDMLLLTEEEVEVVKSYIKELHGTKIEF